MRSGAPARGRRGGLSEGEAAGRRAHLAEVSSHWQILRISPEIVDRARRPFPGEPIRTLDAIHLASALVACSAVPGLKLLSLDERVRRAGRAVVLNCYQHNQKAPKAVSTACRRRHCSH